MDMTMTSKIKNKLVVVLMVSIISLTIDTILVVIGA